METITSRQNPLMTHIRKLAGSAAYRRQTGECLCDSPKLLREAAQWGADVRTVVSVLPWDGPLPDHVRQVLVPPEGMSSISPAKTPQGVLFTCAIPVLPVPETLPGRRYVVLDGVQDPGNVGTVLRTLDAFDADGLLLTGGCADPFGPHGGGVPPSGMERNAGGAGSPAAPQRHPPVRCGPAAGRPGRPAGGLFPMRPGHRLRGTGPQPGGAGPVRQNRAHPHVSPLRVAERGHRGGGAAVGKLAINEGGGPPWRH